MPILITKHGLRVSDLYDMRDDIGLSRKECALTSTCDDLRKAKDYRYRAVRIMTGVDLDAPRNNLTVYIWDPANDHDKAVILDGRKRLKALLSYIDDNYPLNEGACSLDLDEQLRVSGTRLSERLRWMTVHTVVVTAASYWEAVIEFYPEICEWRTETVEHEQQMLQELLASDDPIFADKGECTQRLAELTPRLRFPTAYSHVLISDKVEDDGTVVRRREDVTWKVRALKFVIDHHDREVSPL